MSTSIETSNAIPSQVRGVRRMLFGLFTANIFGFLGIAWMIESQLTDLRLEVGVLRAINDNRFAVDQRTYSPGQGRVYYQLDSFNSVGELIRDYEKSVLSIHVPSGTYGKDWYLVDENTNVPIKYSSDKDLDLGILEAGIKPGMLLSVVRNPNG